MAAIKALELWCKLQCDGYRDVAITNMTTSFRNGLAFCALIHKYRPDLIDFDSLKKEDVFENNKLAFQIAEEKLGIPALLDAEDMVALRIPDRLSILTYVSQYYNYFKAQTPIGGIKRPAEGSKEEPSEKKNLPVVAKTFVSKNGSEKRSSFILPDKTSPKLVRAAAQKVSTNCGTVCGTLTSKCAACNCHVHLVQRHFAEGKLYHRSCFKCSECGNVLHPGSYQPGKKQGTFVCTVHKNSPKTPSSECAAKKGLVSSVLQVELSRSSSSILTAPLPAARTPLSPSRPAPSWTASAQKTQAARQKFFQSAPQSHFVTSMAVRKPIETSSESKISQSPVESATRPIGGKLAEQNRNNNNKRPFVIRSAETRFFERPNSVEVTGFRKDEADQSSSGFRAVKITSNIIKVSPSLEANNHKAAKPTAVPKSTKADPVKHDRKIKPNTFKNELHQKKVETEHCGVGFISTNPCHISAKITSPPFAETPARAAVFQFEQQVLSPQNPSPAFQNSDIKHTRHFSANYSLPCPDVESISCSAVSSNLGNPSAAKKGKYLSPTNAFRSEMRSSSAKPFHVPVEQIEKELNDIERSLAELEEEGVELEKRLRHCEEEGDGDILVDPLMVEWFHLIRKKQIYIRKESELVYIAKTQELEEQQPGVEGELRRLLEKPDHLKSINEHQREKKLMQRLIEIIDDRNAIVEGLDEDRLREVEEDQELNKMMQSLGVEKTETKRRSSLSKLFRRRTKRRVE